MTRRTIRICDELSWKQFGAPDPVFFDRFIKDQTLHVLEQVGDYYTIQDPTDPDGVFTVASDWVAPPVAKQLRIAHSKRKSA